MFFFNAGWDSFGGSPGSPGGWDNISEMRKVYDSIPAAERSGYSVLVAWRKITLEHFNAEYRSDPTSVINYAKENDSRLNEAYIGELTKDGQLRLISMEFNFDQSSNTPISSTKPVELPPGPGKRYYVGDEVTAEYIGHTTLRAMQDKIAWDLANSTLDDSEYALRNAIHVVDVTIKSGDPDMGGPIDALTLTPTYGIKWRQRKENCPAE
jgi:hypothetical protein